MRPHPRLFIPTPLANGLQVDLLPKQTHYVLHVLRLQNGDLVRLFNGVDGEWEAQLVHHGKSMVLATLKQQLRPQPSPTTFPYHLAFAVLKHDPLRFLIEKATELGVASLTPLITERTQVRTVNLERLHLIAIEAAEQCDRLTVPTFNPLQTLQQFILSQSDTHTLVVGDERREAPLFQTYLAERSHPNPLVFMIGPEGGFSPAEFSFLEEHPTIARVTLCPHILRAETAGLCALSLLASHATAAS